MNAQYDGAHFETLASEYIEQRGLRVTTRNFRSKGGEIDLIAQDNKTCVFIEVKYRRSDAFGSAAEQVTASKVEKLRRCAAHYLATTGYSGPCRFDVIGISGKAPAALQFNWIKNAF